MPHMNNCWVRIEPTGYGIGDHVVANLAEQLLVAKLPEY